MWSALTGTVPIEQYIILVYSISIHLSISARYLSTSISALNSDSGDGRDGGDSRDGGDGGDAAEKKSLKKDQIVTVQLFPVASSLDRRLDESCIVC